MVVVVVCDPFSMATWVCTVDKCHTFYDAYSIETWVNWYQIRPMNQLLSNTHTPRTVIMVIPFCSLLHLLQTYTFLHFGPSPKRMIVDCTAWICPSVSVSHICPISRVFVNGYSYRL